MRSYLLCFQSSVTDDGDHFDLGVNRLDGVGLGFAQLAFEPCNLLSRSFRLDLADEGLHRDELDGAVLPEFHRIRDAAHGGEFVFLIRLAQRNLTEQLALLDGIGMQELLALLFLRGCRQSLVGVETVFELFQRHRIERDLATEHFRGIGATDDLRHLASGASRGSVVEQVGLGGSNRGKDSGI